jgi:hypothetical protein
MSSSGRNRHSPHVLLLGDAEHPDFVDSVALLRSSARLDETSSPPELIVIAQTRPGESTQQEIDSLRKRYPLSGIVALLGSWCEGETRTGWPWPGVIRLYWYEFPWWWKRQLDIRSSGLCPDWSKPTFDFERSAICRPPDQNCLRRQESRNRDHGLVVLHTEYHETADALSDLLSRAGYATVWQRPRRARPVIRGATSGIWDGGQLNDGEVTELSTFCRQMARDVAPVLALLDFPRRDRVVRASDAGAAAVLGKPWLHADLLASLDRVIAQKRCAIAA